jgi:hypothetical protein
VNEKSGALPQFAGCPILERSDCMRKFTLPIVSVLIVSFIAVLAGCAPKQVPPTGFIDDSDKMEKVKNLPFHRVWIKPDLDSNRYSNVMIAPVNTEYMLKMGLTGRVKPRDGADKAARKMAGYIKEKLQSTFFENGYPLIVSKPTKKTIIIEPALIELTPARPLMNFLFVLGFFSRHRGSIAIEARLKDGESGEVIAMFADRRYGQAAIFSFKNFGRYAHPKKIVRDWSAQLTSAFLSDPGTAIPEVPKFTLSPW